MSISSKVMDFYKHDVTKKVRRGIFRYIVFGGIMITAEVAFYSITKIGRQLPEFLNWLFQYGWLVDDALKINHIWDIPVKTFYGQASLWMFFVYATIFVFGLEPMYNRMKNVKWYFRGLVYMFIINSMECLTGWILVWSTGYEIWYYIDPLNILRYTSLAISPMWFIVGLVSERFIDIIQRLTEMKGILKENNLSTRRS